ncbi:tail fiber assembly protein [Pseudomonas sp.]|uniref:tail fiber assembly protein n=1 Tax=Pseudomonas sp. TaxID=306 RepID=UPI0028A6575C|nr:tail fiber assembly protein [Pseudomonas sp.]
MTDICEEALGTSALETQSEPVSWWLEPGIEPPTLCNVHRETGEYLCVSQADPSPLEPGVWLFPAFSHRVAPPQVREHFASILDLESQEWRWARDHRGATVYSTDDGTPRRWEHLGELPDGYTTKAPTSAFDHWVVDQWVTHEVLRAKAARQVAYSRQALSDQYALARISTLHNATDLGVATEADNSALEAWKLYRVELNRLSIASLAPNDLRWPSSPNDEALAVWLGGQIR